jgi:hypothetical protein
MILVIWANGSFGWVDSSLYGLGIVIGESTDATINLATLLWAQCENSEVLPATNSSLQRFY